MAKSKCISGAAIFAFCMLLQARVSLWAKNADDSIVTQRGERVASSRDHLGLLSGLQKYIWVIGVVGLLVAVEDYYAAQAAAKKRKLAQSATPPPSIPPPAA